ncbi:MAG: hypothetical protein EXQ91_00600 [Alphaproteobacteria bacterium]|nr:hypothetical protein [Alphaproteobacteria bacterium]
MDYSVTEVAPFDPKEIAPGHFVGAGAKPLADGSVKAVQIVVFPESMRGTGEGHRAWDVVPDGTMTNATVVASVDAADGRSITLKLADRSVRVSIPADVTPVSSPRRRAISCAKAPTSSLARRKARIEH